MAPSRKNVGWIKERSNESTMNYRRAYRKGGCYFFTVVTCNRRPLLTEPENINRLRESFRYVMKRHPFVMDAVVVLPDHFHCIWRMPEEDADFSTRLRLIKRHFSIGMEAGCNKRGEKGVWQRRFWEHLIRDEDDWRRHVDYIHYNPVKHGYVKTPSEWAHSSFERAVERGWYKYDWGADEPESVRGIDLE
jgi:putative transposase